MEYKAFPSVVKAIDGRTVTGIASSFGVLDDYNDIITRGAFKKTIKEGRSRFRHLWQHDFRQPPVAKIVDIREVGVDELPDELKATPHIKGGLQVTREYLRSQRGDEVLEAVMSGAINEMSIGFDPIISEFGKVTLDDDSEVNVRFLKEIMLYDTSDVNWGANRYTAASKAFIPYKNTGYEKALDTGWAPPVLTDFTDQPWQILPDAEKDRIAAHFAFRGAADSFESLQFAHHLPARDGIGPAVWAGVKAAMSGLKSISISDKTAQMCYNHLKEHYSHWEKDAPPFEWYVLARVLKDVSEHPAVCNAHEYQLVKQLLHKVDLRLSQAEPGTTPLTSELERRLIEVRLTSLHSGVREQWTHEQPSLGRLTLP